MISIVVPTYNGADRIGRTLKALEEQDFPGDYEIVVVDDGSTDGTADVVSEFKEVRLVCQKNAGPAAARNRGVEECNGELVLFTDDDCVPREDWLRRMSEAFENEDVIGVKGAYRTNQKEVVARFVQLEYEDKYRLLQKHENIDFIDTYSAGFRRDIFIESGGYDTTFPVACAEDVELSFRLSTQGCKMRFVPDAIVYHTHPDSLWKYLRKKYKFSFWRIFAVKKNPDKLVSDSHTPQTMKFQLLIPLLLLGTGLFIPFWAGAMWFVFGFILLFILLSAPFTIRAIKSDPLVGALAPVLLFFRSCSQFAGVAMATVRLVCSPHSFVKGR
jgi:cellulose synthase/poly-beta-1,6-N-acetylglucosamine synthase-like glycosyltransferase